MLSSLAPRNELGNTFSRVETSGAWLAAGLSVCARVSSGFSYPWFTWTIPDGGRVLYSKLEFSLRGAARSALASFLPQAGCWRGLLRGHSCGQGQVQWGGLWVSPEGPAAHPSQGTALAGPDSFSPSQQQAGTSPFGCPAASPPPPPPLLCTASLFSFTPVTHTPQWGHSAPRWGLLLEFLGKHWDPGALQPYPSHH